MLCPIGQSNEKPPLQVLAKWWEYVTGNGDRSSIMSMSGMCEKCCIGIRRENRNKVRVEITGISTVWDQVIEKWHTACLSLS